MSVPTLMPAIVRAGSRAPVPWQDWNLLALAGLQVYSTALGWQAQLVSYPLFRHVPAEDFVDYHAAYNDAIPVVVIVPGFLAFLGAAAFTWSRPADVPKGVAHLVSAAGVVSLLSTVLWAIPRHDELDRDGQSAAAINSLLQANLLRSLSLTTGTVALGWCIRRCWRRTA